MSAFTWAELKSYLAVSRAMLTPITSSPSPSRSLLLTRTVAQSRNSACGGGPVSHCQRRSLRLNVRGRVTDCQPSSGDSLLSLPSPSSTQPTASSVVNCSRIQVKNIKHMQMLVIIMLFYICISESGFYLLILHRNNSILLLVLYPHLVFVVKNDDNLQFISAPDWFQPPLEFLPVFAKLMSIIHKPPHMIPVETTVSQHRWC